jgi:hypothetical protein
MMKTNLEKRKKKKEWDLEYNMIGVGIVTYDRPERFQEAYNAIQSPFVDRYFHVKDGGAANYEDDYENLWCLEENKGVGFCKNLIIENLLNEGCDKIFILEDDLLITNNEIWRYCIDFSDHTGLLHFNWNNYRSEDTLHHPAIFPKFDALISYNADANFSYFDKRFLEEIRFDEQYVNAWEHVDVEYQGVLKGFLPAFRMFVSPTHLNRFMRVNDGGTSSIVGRPLHQERIMEGYDHWIQKGNTPINELHPLSMEEFKVNMKAITEKYGRR